MAEEHIATQVVDSHHAEHTEVAVDNVQGSVVLLTWVVFFIVAFLLTKFAWKPILNGLDKREKDLQDSLDNADRIKEEMEQLASKTEAMLQEAEEKSNQIISEARAAATQAAKIIEQKAREESKIIIENAQREIDNSVNQARSTLKHESAQIAVQLAGKILSENIDDQKNKDLVNKFIKEL